MNCWSCQKDIPQSAEFCPHCEAEVLPTPSEDEMSAAAIALSAMSPDMLGELYAAFDESATGEEFVNRIMVGDCPKCGSPKTSDCENDPEIDDPCVGRCFQCGQLWCLDCDLYFKNAMESTKHDCPAWEDMDLEDDGFTEES